MQAWIDDSGAKGQRGWMTLAGLTGKAEDWAEFSRLWNAQLRAEPSIEYLSTHEAATLTGQFKNWPRWQRDAKVARLVTKIKQFPFTVVSVAVELAVFDSLRARLVESGPKPPRRSPIPKRRRTFSEQPYFFLFHNVCSAVCLEMIRQGVREEIDLFFDRQDVMKPRILEWYPMYLASLRDHERAIMPSEPIFRDDKTFMPLQAADFVAWVERATLNGEHHPFAELLRRLRRVRRSIYSATWDAAHFQRTFLYQDRFAPSAAEAEYAAKLRDYLGLNGS